MNAEVAQPKRSPALVDDAEADLWQAFKAENSPRAREQLFERYHGFARGMARRHKFNGDNGDIELPDLYQWACAGLLEALDGFDPGLGVPFKGYARRRIKGSILDGISKASEIREQISFRNRARTERTRSLGVDDPDKLSSDEAMKALIDLTVGLAIGFMLEDVGASASEETVDKRPSAYESLAWKELLHRLGQAITSLGSREQSVVRQHYLNALSFEQIGALLGVTKGRVSQIHKSAIRQLRERLHPSQHFKVET